MSFRRRSVFQPEQPFDRLCREHGAEPSERRPRTMLHPPKRDVEDEADCLRDEPIEPLEPRDGL